MNQTIALHKIDIASPCTASWDKMKGDSRVRHCGDCNKNVFNLSAMPEAEAAALLAGNTKGELCVRFYRRADGTVMTSDCGSSPRAAVRQAWRKLPGVASLAFVAMAAAGCTAAPAATVFDAPVVVQPKPEVPMQVMMGAPPATVVAPEPAPPPVLMGKIAAPRPAVQPSAEKNKARR
jgi:hypothetical protein